MTRTSIPFTSIPFPPAYSAWQNAVKLWETAFAAPLVVAHRSARMAMAGPYPNARDRGEFTRMWPEKVEAFGESWVAMAMHMYSLNVRLATTAAQLWWQGWTALAPLAFSSSPAAFIKASSAFWRTAGSPDISASFSRMAGKGLTPIHRRATANATRLSRMKTIRMRARKRH